MRVEPDQIEFKEWFSEPVAVENWGKKISRDTIKSMSEVIARHQGYEALFEEWTETGRLEAEEVAASFVNTSKGILEEIGKKEDRSGSHRKFRRRRGSRKLGVLV